MQLVSIIGVCFNQENKCLITHPPKSILIRVLMKYNKLKAISVLFALASFSSNASNTLNVTCEEFAYDHGTMQQHTNTFSIRSSEPKKLIETNPSGISVDYNIFAIEETKYGQVIHANKSTGNVKWSMGKYNYTLRLELSRYSSNHYIGHYERINLRTQKDTYEGTPHVKELTRYYLANCRNNG